MSSAETTEHPNLNIVPETSEARTPISEEAARELVGQLRAANQDRPSIRSLAVQWGWHRSRVERLLSRVDAETTAEAPRETGCERLIACSGPVDDDWVKEANEDGTVLVHEQPFTAIYFNNAGQLVIRQKGDVFEDDPAIFIAPEYIDRLIARLIECRDQGT